MYLLATIGVVGLALLLLVTMSSRATKRQLEFKLVRAERRTRRAERDATTDPLTGLHNRRHWNELTDRLIRARRHFAVILFDLANLKAANAVHGHFGADELLRKVAGVIRKRGEDTAIRMGGDEFALVLPGMSVQTARVVRDRLEFEVGFEELKPGLSTFVVGTCTEWVPGMSPSDLLEQLKLADLRLEGRKDDIKRDRGEPMTRDEALAHVARSSVLVRGDS